MAFDFFLEIKAIPKIMFVCKIEKNPASACLRRLFEMLFIELRQKIFFSN